MKKYIFTLFLLAVLSCGNSTVKTDQPGQSSNHLADGNGDEKKAGAGKGVCGNNIVFQKGTVIQTSNFDGAGKELAKQTTTVTKVYEEDGMTLSELEMKSAGENGAADKIIKATYKCDGKALYVDMSNFMPGNSANNSIKTSGMQFPFAVAVGEVLPDFEYSIDMTTGGKTRKITSFIKDRKVEAKEKITTAAGTFDCYKITSVIETDLNTMEGMDEDSKKIMEQVKKRMGKTIMTFWYAPDVTIIKMELKMGEKLMARSEVSGIK